MRASDTADACEVLSSELQPSRHSAQFIRCRLTLITSQTQNPEPETPNPNPNLREGIAQALRDNDPTISVSEVDRTVGKLREMYDVIHEGNTVYYNVKLRRSVKLDEVARELSNSMPRWEPAKICVASLDTVPRHGG